MRGGDQRSLPSRQAAAEAAREHALLDVSVDGALRTAGVRHQIEESVGVAAEARALVQVCDALAPVGSERVDIYERALPRERQLRRW